MKFCIEFDPNHPDQLPSVSGGRPDNSLPGSGGHPDNSLPGGWNPGRPVDPGFGQGGLNRPDNSLPGSGARPDNSLPGVDKPVDPEYGVDPKPGAPDQGLPMPSPAKPFTDEEKREIMRLAKDKFTHTELSPMRSIVQAARWVLVTRKKDDGAQGGRPDNSLPSGPGGHPDNSLPGAPARPDNSLPGAPARPDQGLPPSPGRPDNSLPGAQPTPTPPMQPGAPTTPDNSLPPTAQPKSNY